MLVGCSISRFKARSSFLLQWGWAHLKSKAQDVKVAVRCALQHGIRHIDTASIYKNETEIGEVIREYINNGSLTRNDLYVTSKVSPFEMKDEATTHAASKAILDRLGLDYVDLMLIHWPGAAKTELSSPENAKKRQRTWRALEELYTKGFARAIGVSNYEIHHLEQLVTYAKVLPVLNQVECHPKWPQNELRQFCFENNIALAAYSPFATGDFFSDSELFFYSTKDSIRMPR
ncbi:hypothetical protein Ndes2526B_g04759 [Nannochloris sp. 'desiccata']